MLRYSVIALAGIEMLIWLFHAPQLIALLGSAESVRTRWLLIILTVIVPILAVTALVLGITGRRLALAAVLIAITGGIYVFG